MSEMIERVARAIKDEFYRAPTSTWNGCARAAIEAMRGPTPDMVAAIGFPAGLEGLRCWRAMIDAALKETTDV
jgi:hypothetical protein